MRVCFSYRKKWLPALSGLFVFGLLLPAQAQVSPPVKQQLPSAPMPGGQAPATPPPVIVQPPAQEKPAPPAEEPPAAPRAQETKPYEPAVPLKDKLTFGGSFGLWFGNITYIELSPLVGYKFTDKFAAGPGITYQFLSEDGVSVNNYGGRLFARYLITEQIYAHTEYQYLSRELVLVDRERIGIPMFYIGAGYRLPVGNQSSLGISLLYDLLDKPNSPYQNPMLQIGFMSNF